MNLGEQIAELEKKFGQLGGKPLPHQIVSTARNCAFRQDYLTSTVTQEQRDAAMRTLEDETEFKRKRAQLAQEKEDLDSSLNQMKEPLLFGKAKYAAHRAKIAQEQDLIIQQISKIDKMLKDSVNLSLDCSTHPHTIEK